MNFAQAIISWQKKYGRHDLPWQHPITPYRVWISEIMLQQTQVKTVRGYFTRFMEAFPTVSDLAAADLDSVNALWAGLGYYRRARNMHQAAKIIVTDHQGNVPVQPELLVQLPGIGTSTAHAIASIAGNLPFAILDANVKRVLARYYGIEEDLEKTSIKKMLFNSAQALMPPSECRTYTQGMMDLGASLCGKVAQCSHCPLREACTACAKHLQTTIPKKKKRKQKPTRVKHYLVLLVKQQVLLIKRPADGVWPELWCLPEFEDAPSMLSTLHTLSSNSLIQAETIEHSFTHYHLQIVPYILTLHSTKQLSNHVQQAWVHFADLNQYGMPAPIEKFLLSDILDHQNMGVLV